MSCPINAGMSARVRAKAPRRFKKIQRNLERARRIGATQQGLYLQEVALMDYRAALVMVRKHGGVGLDRLV